MKIGIHDNLREARVIPVTRVVIYDDFDNPLAVAMDCGNNAIVIEQLAPGREAEFHNLLRQMGVNKVVIATDVPLKTIDELRMS